MTLPVVFEHFSDRHPDFLTGFVTLLVSVGLSFVAGIYLGSVNEVLLLIPGLMVLVTPSINMRGAIAGILTSRLSSSMHLGAFETSLARNTELGDNLRSSLILTIILSAALAVFGKLICLIAGIEVIGFFEMIIISVVSGTAAGLVVTIVGVLVSLFCYKRNHDLDMVGAPAVTTIGDMVTLPCLVAAALIIMHLPPVWMWILGILVLALFVWAVIAIFRGTVLMKDILKEGLPLLLPLSLLGIVAGVLYTNQLDSLIAAAAVLILMSPFMNGCGSVGGILTSRIGTEMHMGLIDAKLLPQKRVWSHFLENYVYALVILPLMGILSHFAALMLDISTPGLVPMLLLSLAAGLIVITVMNLLGYYTAAATYKIGLDPDNFGVPVVTSSIDLIGATALLVVMGILL